MVEKIRAPRFVIISPMRNEEENLPRVIASLTRQTVRPWKWIIVNDGSTDATGRIANDAQAKHGWIDVVHRADRGFRKPGGGVIEAFNDGYRRIGSDDWDFIVKFDADLSFEADYFERIAARFKADPQLGIGGGLICKEEAGGKLVAEWLGDPPFHVRGATKIYRAECWKQLGGLHPAPGWDTLDELKANMLGWRTCTFSELKLHHHRHAGEADGAWVNWVKNGRANYITGYLPAFMFAKCAARALRKPYFIGAMGLLWGFISGYLKRMPQIEDTALIRYVRQQQMKRLLRQPSLWG